MSSPLPGYIYILELTSGITKVGYSRTVEGRLKQHARDLQQSDIEISRRWISPKHIEAAANEQALKAACARLGGQHYGPPRAEEWFTGLRFDDVVAAAELLPITPHDGPRTVTGNEARTKLRDLLDEVAYNDSHIHVSRYDRPIAVIVSAAWYKRAAAVTLTSAKTGEQR